MDYVPSDVKFGKYVCDVCGKAPVTFSGESGKIALCEKHRLKDLDAGKVEPLSTDDKVNNPKHYNSSPSGVECITIVEHMTFNCGNAVKYIFRANHKGSLLEDLKKAAWYINREIERIQKFKVDK